MDTRKAKQVIYGAFYLLVFLGIGLRIYFSFFYAAPSCFDHVQNQNELGVDCGGVCSAVCIPSDLSHLSPINVQLFEPYAAATSSPYHYSVLGQVANLNTGFAAKNFAYRFDFYGASGTIVGSLPGKSFLYSGEVKYILAPDVQASAPADRAELVILDPEWVQASDMGLVPQFSLENLGAGPSSSSTISANGQIMDQDVASFTNVLVVGVFYDDMNHAVGASETLIDGIGPGETQQFSVIYPNIGAAGIDPTRTKFFAYAVRH